MREPLRPSSRVPGLLLACRTQSSQHQRHAGHTISLCWSNECCYNVEIDRHIRRPAIALRFETRVVVGMLYSFIASHGWQDIFRLSLATERRHGTRVFAEKLMRDKQYVLMQSSYQKRRRTDGVLIKLGSTTRSNS